MGISDLYYIIAGIAYGIFIVKFVLSMCVGDIDTDVDIDGDAEADFDMSSIFSFKGLIHFCMGFFGWLAGKQYFTCEIQTSDYFISALLGIVFVIVLYYVYKLCTKFQHIPTDVSKFRTQFFGCTGTISCIVGDTVYVNVPIYGEIPTIPCENSRKVALTCGQKVVILGFNKETNRYTI